MTSAPRRLVGVELFSDRAGDAATFYAWLLGPGSGRSPHDWSPISLLVQHGLCGIHVCDDDGPRPSWVPVFSVRDVAATVQRATRAGFRHVQRDGRCYLVDPEGAWTRVVPADRLPPEVDVEALGYTMMDYLSADVAATNRDYAEALDVTAYQVVDDPDDYHLLTADGVLQLAVMSDARLTDAPTRGQWLVYFQVPDIRLTVERAAAGGVEVVVAPSDEGYAEWAILRDPGGLLFGLSRFRELAAGDFELRDAEGRVHPMGIVQRS